MPPTSSRQDSLLALSAMTLSATGSMAAAQTSVSDQIKQGQCLARASDCVACHTAPGSKLFAGGRAMPTPFGTLYSSSITPDLETASAIGAPMISTE